MRKTLQALQQNWKKNILKDFKWIVINLTSVIIIDYKGL